MGEAAGTQIDVAGMQSARASLQKLLRFCGERGLVQYPEAWKEAALELLKAQREVMRRSLGYKRVGWDPIRDKIMAPYERPNSDGIIIPDDRIVRQTLERWDKAGKISDELFELVDDYLRFCAKSGDDTEARQLVSQWGFVRIARALSSMYTISAPPPADFSWSELPLSWTVYADRNKNWENESAYNLVFLRAYRQHESIINIIVGYSPVGLSDLSIVDGTKIVFYEGYLIPLNESGSYASNGRRMVSVKICRPEFRGLSGLGMADAMLEFSDPNHLLSDHDEIHIRSHSAFSLNNPSLRHTDFDEFTNLLLKTFTGQLPIELEFSENTKFDILVENIVSSSYKGYVD